MVHRDGEAVGAKGERDRITRRARDEVGPIFRPRKPKEIEKKTWLEERARYFYVFERLVSESFKRKCIKVGPDKTLRLDKLLGAGTHASVFSARIVDAPLTIDVAAKLLFDEGKSRSKYSIPIHEEAETAAALSRSVLRGETSHFLLFYGDGFCDDIDIPAGVTISDRAERTQQRKNTVEHYFLTDDTEEWLEITRDVMMGRYENLNARMADLFDPIYTDEYFLVYLRENLRLYGTPPDDPSDVVMAPMPTKVRVFVHVMELATSSLRDFIETHDQWVVHDVIGQVFQTVKDFYNVTHMIHSAMHIGNAMVLERDSDVSEYSFVLIDFGSQLPVRKTLNPEALMVSEFMENLLNHYSFRPSPVLRRAIQALITRSGLRQFSKKGGIKRLDVKKLLEIWAGLRPPAS